MATRFYLDCGPLACGCCAGPVVPANVPAGTLEVVVQDNGVTYATAAPVVEDFGGQGYRIVQRTYAHGQPQGYSSSWRPSRGTAEVERARWAESLATIRARAELAARGLPAMAGGAIGVLAEDAQTQTDAAQTTAPKRVTVSPGIRDQAAMAIARERTTDAKLTKMPDARPVSVTYAPQWSCWDGCPFYNNGCYAELGNMGYVTGRLNASGWNAPEVIAEAEAAGIRGLTGQYPLRLHAVGDCKTDRAAAIVSGAAMEYQAKTGAPVWSYTHAWRQVERTSWSGVSILASCETETDVLQADARNYAAERTVMDWADAKPITTPDGRTLKPFLCPEQTGRAKDCESCGFCAKDSAWRGRAYLVLKAHGATRKMRAALENAQRQGDAAHDTARTRTQKPSGAPIAFLGGK